MSAFTVASEERFWTFVKKSDWCWEWIGHRKDTGYGRYPVRRVGSKWTSIGAHRVAWFLSFGDIPDGVCVLHKCDNPPCVRPEHLFLGSMADNVSDCMQKRRHVSHRGEKHGMSKLTATQALEIVKLRRNGSLLEDIGRRFGITGAAVRSIVTGRTWAHVTKATA